MEIKFIYMNEYMEEAIFTFMPCPDLCGAYLPKFVMESELFDFDYPLVLEKKDDEPIYPLELAEDLLDMFEEDFELIDVRVV